MSWRTTLCAVDQRAVAKRLAEWRRRRGFSQARLAGVSGVDPSTISRIELGKISPDLGTVEKLARGLSVEPTVLLGAESARRETGESDAAWREAVRAYLATPFGSDTPATVAERLQTIPYQLLWLQCDRVADVHNLREMLERQWRKLAEQPASEPVAVESGSAKRAAPRRRKRRD